MSSTSSSERPTQQIARKIAMDIYNTKNNGGKIIVTAGPVVVHSGAADSLAKIIRMGYIDGLLTGNALAVHDIENSLFGTSLGMNVKNGTLAIRGHRNHMQAINEVFRAGSIEEMVKKNILKSGIMYECIKNNVQYALCGSIRDDGPIPGVITDIIEAQDRYRAILGDTKMVLMLSTMLHSIAVGNMIPARVKVVAVDISQAVVTKLLDRGTTQAIGIVSDIGAFLPMVLHHLEQISKK
jgi:lysine-ketoglutarate reductase/saccharopine dehydrogenase-like protein (TIGR00300 family)